MSEFTCGNGECIDLKKRCDARVDCQDGADEFKCQGNYVTMVTTLGGGEVYYWDRKIYKF